MHTIPPPPMSKYIAQTFDKANEIKQNMMKI